MMQDMNTVRVSAAVDQGIAHLGGVNRAYSQKYLVWYWLVYALHTERGNQVLHCGPLIVHSHW